jgi:hypothetical protein
MNYMTTKSQVLTDIGIGILATTFLVSCWGREGWLFQAGLLWAGANFGYLITVYLNGDDE